MYNNNYQSKYHFIEKKNIARKWNEANLMAKAANINVFIRPQHTLCGQYEHT